MPVEKTIGTTLTREELYEQVWSTPVLQLAKKYGLSDVGLAKVCKRLLIPRPSVGYWAKAATGRKGDRPNLPIMVDPSLLKVTLIPSRRQARPTADPARTVNPNNSGPAALADADLAATFERFTLAFPSIDVPKQLEKPLPAITLTLQALRQASKEYRTRGPTRILPIHQTQFNNRRTLGLDVRVTRRHFVRAATFLNTLLRAFQACGWKLTLPRDRHTPSWELAAGVQTFRLRLVELRQEQPHRTTKKELNSQTRVPGYQPPSTDSVPSGRFSFMLLGNDQHHPVLTWSDDSSGVLELRITQIVRRIFEHIDSHVVAWKRHQEQLHREHDEEVKQRMAEHDRNETLQREERSQQEERDRVARLVHRVESWELAGRIRAFVACAERWVTASRESTEVVAEFATWKNWALEVADANDPLAGPLRGTHPLK